jgi:hypothetical protein
MKSFFRFVYLAFPLILSMDVHALFGVHNNGKLDQPVLRDAYTSGDFEKVKVSLEEFRKGQFDQASREDQIFSHKYLAVIYAADSTTINRAESYFNLLLNLSPNIELADMFLSRRVQEIFDRVKADIERNRKYTSKYDAFGNPIQSEANKPATVGDSQKPTSAQMISSPEAQPKGSGKVETSSSRKWIWIGTTVAAVGAGTGLYFLTQSAGSKDTETEVVLDGR